MKFTCPRRVEDGTHVAGPLRYSGPNRDKFRSGSCTYCGSMSGDDFMAAVKAGKNIGPTDKNYKAYVDEMAGKFYFQHLSEEQQIEFIRLLNERTVNIGYPGRFYVLPFFIATGQ